MWQGPQGPESGHSAGAGPGPGALNLATLQEQGLGQAADVHVFSHSLGRDTLRPDSRSHAGCHEGAQDKMLWPYPTATLCQDDLSQIMAAPQSGALQLPPYWN